METVVRLVPAPDERGRREAFECPPGAPVSRARGTADLLNAGQPLQRGIGRPEPELPVEPERPALDRLLVPEADLERVDGEGLDPEVVAVEPEKAAVDECRLAVPEGGEDVEADREAAQERVGVPVADRDPVPEEEDPVSRPQREPPLRHDPYQEDLEPPAARGRDDGGRVAVREGVELPVTRRHRRPAEVEGLRPLPARESPDGERPGRELPVDRHVLAGEERPVVHERRDPLPSHPRPGGRTVAEGPDRPEAEGVEPLRPVRAGEFPEPVQQPFEGSRTAPARRVDPSLAVQVRLHERLVRRERDEPPERPAEAVAHPFVVPREPDLPGEPLHEPPGLQEREGHLDRGPRDAGDLPFEQRLEIAPGVREPPHSSAERTEEPLAPLENRGGVGVGPEEEERLVEPDELRRVVEAGLLHLAKQRPDAPGPRPVAAAGIEAG